MFRGLWQRLMALALWPLFLTAKAEAAKAAADAVADMLNRADAAEAAGQPALAEKLRALAASLQIEEAPEILLSLPAPSANGHPATPALPAPSRKPGRPKKEESREANESPR